MKQFSRRFCSLTAALFLTAALLVPMAWAAARASDYFAFTDAVAYAEENGKILIEADVCATGMMDEIGVKSITIYEKQSDGYYDDVLPPDQDRISEGLDKELIKNIVTLGIGFVVIVGLCIALLYVL